MDRADDRHRSDRRHRPKSKRSKYDDKRHETKPAKKKDDIPSKTGGGDEKQETKSLRKKDDITTKTGGAYIPPAKLRMMRDNITDKTRYWKCSFELTGIFF